MTPLQAVFAYIAVAVIRQGARDLASVYRWAHQA